MSDAAFEQLLAGLGFEEIQSFIWQVEYSLVWAIKSGDVSDGGVRPLPQILVCPKCSGELERTGSAWTCSACAGMYPVALDGVIEMIRK
jgi:hypothetical protein